MENASREVARLIDDDKTYEVLAEYYGYTEWWQDNALEEALKKVPTVDAVPVVRCKNCKWWKTNYSWNGGEHKVCVKEAYEPSRKAEDFCSRGERKDNETDRC